jgi:predicted DNA-binding transcriptional regulator YafY
VKTSAAKLLATLELLQAHGRLSGAELARRLEVDRRTVRRYVAALEEMGIPVTTELGRDGGYGLVAGFKLPPMLFTDDEALALSLGLLAARGLGLARAAPGLGSAQAKLERVMPEGLRKRVRAADETMALDLPGAAPGSEAIDAATLAELSAATQACRAVQLSYRAADGSASERRVDPYGLAFRGGRWYAAGWCHLRGGVRHFRVDRIAAVRRRAESFVRPRDFDVLAELTAAIATLPRAHSAEVLLDADLPMAKRALFAALGRLEPIERPRRPGRRERPATLLFVETDDLEWLARELARLPFACEIRRPVALRRALVTHAARLVTRHRLPRRRESG